jgi:hypothetical protein
MKNISLVFIIALLVLGCGQPQQADLDQAKKFMEGDSLTAPDTAKAISYFESAANGGNSEAMYYLAYYHQYGIGVDKSGELALDWYRRSAEANYPRAQNKMGMIYYTGSGADQDYAEALKWFTKSAKQGYDQAQYMLGKIYSLGRGVEPDTTKAIMWLKKAVAGGHPYPEFLLGKLLYETGDLEQAYEWVKKSADKGVGHAKELLEKMGS